VVGRQPLEPFSLRKLGTLLGELCLGPAHGVVRLTQPFLQHLNLLLERGERRVVLVHAFSQPRNLALEAHDLFGDGRALHTTIVIHKTQVF
jgi:hypothetical protein